MSFTFEGYFSSYKRVVEVVKGLGVVIVLPSKDISLTDNNLQASSTSLRLLQPGASWYKKSSYF